MRYARRRDGGEEQHATALELFYDLVFVFAVTQVSHLLLEHLTIEGAAQSLLLLMVDLVGVELHDLGHQRARPRRGAGAADARRGDAASLLMAVAIPEAFGERALLFACSYVAIQVCVTAFLAFVACVTRHAGTRACRGGS